MGINHKNEIKVTHLFHNGYGVGRVIRKVTPTYVVVEWGPPTNSSSMESVHNLKFLNEEDQNV